MLITTHHRLPMLENIGCAYT
uniref:Uncharacterized protein n=1 Tax=Arundo donax TaxID=35708 RepID=A0A0A9QES8_ARUDO